MLPVLEFDASTPLSAERLAALALDVGRACRDIGFFYLRVAGFGARIEAAFAASRRFFALPAADKAALPFIGNRGYAGFHAEALDPGRNVDDKEAFNVGLEIASPRPDEANHWPDLPGFRTTMLDYFSEVWRIGRQVHKAIAVDLDLPADFFESRLDRPMATLRLLHYPPATAREYGLFGAGEHTDYGNLTLLLTDDAGGLELRRRGGGWMAAPPIPGTFVCNIGDCLMRWTNDVYVSTPHRVVSPIGRDRYSIAFFLDPNPEALVAAIPSCCAPERPSRYPPIAAADYLAERLARSLVKPA